MLDLFNYLYNNTSYSIDTIKNEYHTITAIQLSNITNNEVLSLVTGLSFSGVQYETILIGSCTYKIRVIV
jgi:hypothetical protein